MRSAATAAMLALGLTTCGEVSPGVDPPDDRLAFPSGLLLDPRISSEPTGMVCVVDEDCGSGELCASGSCRASARWLLVTNANSDLRYNSGSLVPIDLDDFWAALDQEILPAGSKLSKTDYDEDPERHCRRLANIPQTIECTEEPFTVPEATAYFGNFPGPIEPWDRDPGDDEMVIFVPVRGDPSITWFELSGGLGSDEDLDIDCGQAGGVSRCDDRHRLRFLRNDPDALRISREPFRVHVSAQADQPYAYVSHALVGNFPDHTDPDFTLIDLDGLAVGGDGLPAIVDQRSIFTGGAFLGGFGLAQRPCDVESGNAPESSLGCTRPRVYGASRWQTVVRVMTVVQHLPEPESGQVCVGPDDVTQTGGLNCDPKIEEVTRFSAGGLSTIAIQPTPSRPILADIEFSANGNELYVVQSNPGGLLRIDTSIDEDEGEPRDLAVAQVEVCAQPTSMTIYDDGENRFGLVTCYRSAEVFIVELTTLTVVGLVRAGTGPDAMSVDLPREVVYVANTLDATISVVDMSPTRETRFTELARIGLQEPYTG